MESRNRKIIVAISGASGSIYALKLLEKLDNLIYPPGEIAVIFSGTAKTIWKQKLVKKLYFQHLRRSMIIKHFMLRSHQVLPITTQ